MFILCQELFQELCILTKSIHLILIVIFRHHFYFHFYREGNWNTESLNNSARVTQLMKRRQTSPLAVSMLLPTHLLFCLLEVSGMWKSHKPIKTVIAEKEHLPIFFLSFIQLLKRKLWGRHCEQMWKCSA